MANADFTPSETLVSTKLCTKCGDEKCSSAFAKRAKSKDGLMAWCRPCMSQYQAERKQDPEKRLLDNERDKRWYEANKKKISQRCASGYAENKETILARNKAWAEANKEKYKEAIKRWDSENKDKRAKYAANYRLRHPERIKEYTAGNKLRQADYSKQWREENRERIAAVANEYKRNRRLIDPKFVLIERVRARLRGGFRYGGMKSKSTLEILGCEWDFFVLHIERQFKKNMNWDNRSEWHIDHIVPLATATTDDDVIRLNHFTNMRPIWAHENLAKSDSVTHLI